MRNLITILFFIFAVSFQSKANSLSNCNELFTSTIATLEQTTVFHLDQNKINYKKSVIEGHNAFIILPKGEHPLNQYASMLKEHYEHTLAVSPGLTPKIDSALYAFDIETLFTSVKDITMNKVGAATLHETVHLKRAMLEQDNELHLVYNANIKSITGKNIFNSQDMYGYESFASFDEIEAYATELQYSLTQFKNTQTIEDIDEASARLNAMIKNLKQQLDKFQTNSQRLEISSDESYYYLKLQDTELSIPMLGRSAVDSLDSLLDELKYMEAITSKGISIEVLEKLIQR